MRSWVGPTHCPPSSTTVPSDNAWLRTRPPTRSRASSTTTSLPAATSWRAVTNPAIPAPTTTTSASILSPMGASVRSLGKVVPVAGVDGCRAGWLVVHEGHAEVHRDFAAVLAALPDDAVVAVDMPIGLVDEHVAGGREVDRAARVELGPKRSSVFSAPPRCALGARTLRDARRHGARLTLQT